ncbi:hypothetical protein HKCCSP123_12925 [Rhodobacterales bacterium HKCCSP123]|nr:hypothetical protein [Rhodobacterales bacterium HKCCSP123]
MNLRNKINRRFDALTYSLESQLHLSDNEGDRIFVEDQIHSIAKFWSILNDGERDFINAARLAIEKRMNWR